MRSIAQQEARPWWLGDGMLQESAATPKIACAIDFGNGVTPEAIRSVVQIGVSHVLSGGPTIPWTVSQLQPIVNRLKTAGVTLGNLMIGGFPNTIYGRPDRDEEIEKIRQSIQAAGRVGIPVVEYNFYAHRAVEGYYEEVGRGGAGLTGVDYGRMKDLPPLAEEGTHTLDEMWDNITGCGEGQCAAGAPSQRSTLSSKSWIAANHVHTRRLEAPDRNRGQPIERNHL
jgi:mannonate dehydratase